MTYHTHGIFDDPEPGHPEDDNLVKRLRAQAVMNKPWPKAAALSIAAADEIERLRALLHPYPWHPDGLRRDGHAANCDGPDDWHHPITGHCGDCGCFTCSAER